MILKADSQKIGKKQQSYDGPAIGGKRLQSFTRVATSTQKEKIGDEEGLPNHPDVGSCSSKLSHVSEGELFPVEQQMSRKLLENLSRVPDANGDTSSSNRTLVTSRAKAKKVCQGEGRAADATCGRTLNYVILLPKSSEEKVSRNLDVVTCQSETNQSLKVAQPSLVKTRAKSQLSEGNLHR